MSKDSRQKDKSYRGILQQRKDIISFLTKPSSREDFFMEKVSTNKLKKQQLVAEMVVKAEKAKAIVLTDYKGLTHQQLEAFKKTLRNANAEFSVTKNTLLKRALKEAKLDIGEDSNYNQPTGTLFLYGDPVGPLKTLAKMIKDIQKPAIKYGILDKKGISDQQVMTLATLPSREVLLAQLFAGMKSPISGLHRALSWNMQNLVITLKAIESKKHSAD